MNCVIDASALRKLFGNRRAVDGVSLRVNAGEVVGFLGPNGAGKTTTMRMLTGFLEPTEGRVSLAGIDIDEAPIEARKHFGYLPEGAPAYPEMTVREYLRFVGRARGIASGDLAARLMSVADRVHLGRVMDQSIETLSKGFKRRVGIAQAIIHDPPILIMDEPTDGLDPNQKHEVRELIRQMGSTKAIVLSTHILEEVEAVCSRVVVIAAGRIVFDGTPAVFEAMAPSSVQRHRMDHVFRQLTADATEVQP
ncbi:MAG: ABC transporter ATP-binding protein [Phycisphaerales bacterium]|nr:ABC transporter ATP-binding protein [Phycisphaerales bacterium]